MNRRELLAAIGSAGVVATAGCSTVSGSESLSDPTVHTNSSGRKSLEWVSGGESVGEFGVSGTLSSGLIDVSTELSHREGTSVESIRLRVWMPDSETDTPADVAIVSPVEGDSSPPPSISLYSPENSRGTVVEITDLDDLADETISTIDLLVRPRSETATILNVAARIELAEGGSLGTEYTLDGELELALSALGEQ